MKITYTYSNSGSWVEFTLSSQDYCIFSDDTGIFRDASSTTKNNKAYLVKPNTNTFNKGS